MLRGNSQEYYRQDALRGHSAIAELLDRAVTEILVCLTRVQRLMFVVFLLPSEVSFYEFLFY